MERKCIECGGRLTGRSDKKFCSDQCRTSFNNRLNITGNKIIRRINAILKKNRNILTEMNSSGKTTVPANRLTDRGFDFRYFTSTYTTKAGKTYYYCYEQGYLPIEDQLYMLVRKKEYVG
ncbi:hypothetical protein EDD80_10275 [Anseongella ginsenosidimutans]|uniref:DUF2116 family Zn-ribbon domain-containing protein n=1 Tax=Anseongella ginsenosidimutans TaxID=496056 RepID=A0A4R3KUD6_9SPHI|nr:hypothetical protein [Anseongella ginsenosidimutans]QEC51560.1 hypothetical protein FRZ59_03815 [Anseongella ginsenosidimutans]TCS88885.1 hypothetical protein EDD80_10275 [Anseongella ginsenosidimutans]